MVDRAPIQGAFSDWLQQKLRALNTDDGVFGSYIQGILDGDETPDEKIDALEGILSEIVETDISTICKEIMDKWEAFRLKESQSSSVNGSNQEDVDEKLVRLLESQTLATTVQRQYTDEERRLKDAILSQYGQMTDDEGEEEEHVKGGGDDGGSSSGVSLRPNVNALLVQQAEKEKREHAKLEAQKKKEKDKEDREKQKQMREEKKEKRKTQKGERKR